MGQVLFPQGLCESAYGKTEAVAMCGGWCIKQIKRHNAPHWLLTKITVAYPQGEHGRCLFLCLALAMHYMGLKDEAQQIAALSYRRKLFQVLWVLML